MALLLTKALWFEEINSGSCGPNLFARILDIILAKLWMRLIGLNLSAAVACSFFGRKKMKTEFRSSKCSELRLKKTFYCSKEIHLDHGPARFEEEANIAIWTRSLQPCTCRSMFWWVGCYITFRVVIIQNLLLNFKYKYNRRPLASLPQPSLSQSSACLALLIFNLQHQYSSDWQAPHRLVWPIYLRHSAYASSSFPQGTIDAIDKRRKVSYWTGEKHCRCGNCKVAWDLDCSPKSKEAVSVKNLQVQNRCLLQNFLLKRHDVGTVPWINCFRHHYGGSKTRNLGYRLLSPELRRISKYLVGNGRFSPSSSMTLGSAITPSPKFSSPFIHMQSAPMSQSRMQLHPWTRPPFVSPLQWSHSHSHTEHRGTEPLDITCKHLQTALECHGVRTQFLNIFSRTCKRITRQYISIKRVFVTQRNRLDKPMPRKGRKQKKNKNKSCS